MRELLAAGLEPHDGIYDINCDGFSVVVAVNKKAEIDVFAFKCGLTLAQAKITPLEVYSHEVKFDWTLKIVTESSSFSSLDAQSNDDEIALNLIKADALKKVTEYSSAIVKNNKFLDALLGKYRLPRMNK